MKDFLRRIFNINTEEDFMAAKDKIQGFFIAAIVIGFLYILLQEDISKGSIDRILIGILVCVFLAWVIPKVIKFFSFP